MNTYYQILSKSTPILGYIVKRDTFELLDLSENFLERLNISFPDFKGKTCHKVLHDLDSPCSFCPHKLLKYGEFHNWHSYSRISKQYYILKSTLIPHEEFEYVIAGLAIPISKELSQVPSLQTNPAYDAALSECAQILLEETDTQTSIESLLKTLCIFFGGVYSSIIHYHNGIGTVKYRYRTIHAPYDPKERFNDRSIAEVESWYEFSDSDDNVFLDKSIHQFHKTDRQYKILQESGLDGFVVASLRNPKTGEKLGTMGVANPTMHLEDVQLLRTVSAFVVNFLEKEKLILEFEKISFEDMLTGLRNRNSYERTIQQLQSNLPNSLGIIFADINGLKETNDNLGHEYGDILIKWTAKYLSKSTTEPVYRIGGDEFVIFIPNKTEREFYAIASIIQKGLFEMIYLNLSVGYTWENQRIDVVNQLVRTDKLMYEAKQHYYSLKKYNHMNLATQQQILKEEVERLKNEI
ncbi:GGDEF domain-containing protein [Candidatus Epulonipiscium viviparus]|uniref:GGDEF domain-containing protein n=1 Tax=Candidatus Epulonipiscium viviparus TaxID=420336 RepID=UPI00016BFC83|nr:GGDEF domain-containing protein [Candidatus Epulopiscium viviparus]